MPEPLTCPICEKRAGLCVCPHIRPVETATQVLILQHPREPDRELGTARIAQLCLEGSTLRLGLSWPNLRAALGREAIAAEWAVLYLGSFRPAMAAAAAAGPSEAGAPFLLLDRRGDPLAEQERARAAIRGLVVLDGNWSQAKSLWWRNAWLLKLRRAVLRPPAPSLYGELRREPRRQSLSTIEALALSLSFLEGRPQIAEALLAPFEKLLEAYRRG